MEQHAVLTAQGSRGGLTVAAMLQDDWDFGCFFLVLFLFLNGFKK